jgi:hypothetical protein
MGAAQTFGVAEEINRIQSVIRKPKNEIRIARRFSGEKENAAEIVDSGTGTGLVLQNGKLRTGIGDSAFITDMRRHLNRARRPKEEQLRQST